MVQREPHAGRDGGSVVAGAHVVLARPDGLDRPAHGPRDLRGLDGKVLLQPPPKATTHVLRMHAHLRGARPSACATARWVSVWLWVDTHTSAAAPRTHTVAFSGSIAACAKKGTVIGGVNHMPRGLQRLRGGVGLLLGRLRPRQARAPAETAACRRSRSAPVSSTGTWAACHTGRSCCAAWRAAQ